mgnify:FL=1
MLFNRVTIDFLNGDCQKTEHKTAFIHIPKTGGTSVEFILQNKYGSAHERHYNVRQMQEVLEDEEIDEYKIFTVIRNPFDRIISTWRWWAMHQDGFYSKPQLHKYNIPNTSFKEYVLMIKQYFEGDKTLDDNPGKITIDSERAALIVSHIEKLNWWLAKHDGGLVKCDFLRFEDLNNEWRRYRKQVKISKLLSHKNGSGYIPITNNRTELYDDETYKIISEIYERLIVRLHCG